MKCLLTAVLSMTLLAVANDGMAKEVSLFSPDKNLKVDITDNNDGNLTFSVFGHNTQLLEKSAIGLNTGMGKIGSIKNVKVRKNVSEISDAPFYRQNSVTTLCNEAVVKLNDGISVEFRVFDDGLAYRFVNSNKGETTIYDETASYLLPNDNTLYIPYSTNKEKPLAMAFQNIYDITPVSKANPLPAFLPLTVAYDNGVKLTLLESDLEAYPGMFIYADSTAHTLNGVFANYPSATDFYEWRKQEYVTDTYDYISRSTGARNYPWRVFAITSDDRQMPVNNLVYALASPNRIGDTSWIKPGKVAWDWWNNWGLSGVPFKAGINMDTYKYYIDFAAKNGLEYVILDEGWYEPKSGDMLTVIPELDLQALIDYGKEKGVGIVLWTVFNVLDSQLEEACSKYAAMGVKGFKVDFLDRDDQTAVEMVYRIADATAKHKLFLDLHGFYKPTGINRTYPNIINFEGVFGMEEVKWTKLENNMPLYDVIFPYIRMMAGPVDYTPGAMRNGTKADWKAIYSNPMSMGTRCHQLATYIVHDSPFTMLCDAPTNYRGEQECVDFIASVPVDVDETRIIAGKMGESLVTARRADDNWWVGGLTNWDGRDVTISFDFLPEGKTYKAIRFIDGVNADKVATDYATDTIIVNSNTKQTIRMASGGGFAIRLEPYINNVAKVTAVPDEKRAAIDPFYKKYVDCNGLYVISSDKVSDKALLKAAEIIELMLLKRPDVKRNMASLGCHVLVIGKDEETCDMPHYKDVCTDDPEQIKYWNWRARGFGGSPEHDFSAGCGEENLLALSTDRYDGENILIHEFAHLIHLMGLETTDAAFASRLESLYQSAKDKNLWNGTYALSNKEEYFAEAVQSFFNCNRYSEPPNGIHNSINRRGKLKLYDPEMYAMLTDYFYEIDIPILNTIY